MIWFEAIYKEFEVFRKDDASGKNLYPKSFFFNKNERKGSHLGLNFPYHLI
jgi:hypothetical protein